MFTDDNLAFDGANMSSTAKEPIITTLEINSENILSNTLGTRPSRGGGTVINYSDEESIRMYVWESSYPADFYYKDKIVVQEGETLKLSGKIAIWYNCSSNGKFKIGFSNTNSNSTSDLISSEELSSTFQHSDGTPSIEIINANLQNFEVTINEPGEYYIKGLLYQSSASCSDYAIVTELSIEEN